MSLVPSEHETDVVVHETTLVPVDPKDDRSWFRRALDDLRLFFGRKPLALVERYAEAKVRQEEANAEKTVLEGQGAFLEAQARAQQLRLQGLGQFAKDIAEAEKTNAEVDDALVSRLLEKMRESKSPEEAMAEVEDIVQRIKFHGGTVEFIEPDSFDNPSN